jgi:hypothetical protein
MREHASEAVAVADIMPAAVGDRALNSAEYRRVEVVVYEALHKLAKRGTSSRPAGAQSWHAGGCYSGAIAGMPSTASQSHRNIQASHSVGK